MNIWNQNKAEITSQVLIMLDISVFKMSYEFMFKQILVD